MKQLRPYLSLIIPFVLVFLLWQKNRELLRYRMADNKRAQEVIQNKELHIQTLDSAVSFVLMKARKDSAEFKVAQIASNEEIKGYKRTIAKLRPLIQDKIDSFPDLREFVSSQDSVIDKQDSLLRAQDLYCALQIKDFQEILALHQQKFAAQAQISDAWMDMATQAQKETSKEKRRKNFFKVVSGVLVGGIVYMSLKE